MATAYLLLSICFILFVTTFISGYLPIYCAFSSATIRTFNAVSIGIVLGSALFIIIPESLETMDNTLDTKRVMGLALFAGVLTMSSIDRCLHKIEHDVHTSEYIAVDDLSNINHDEMATV